MLTCHSKPLTEHESVLLGARNGWFPIPVPLEVPKILKLYQGHVAIGESHHYCAWHLCARRELARRAGGAATAMSRYRATTHLAVANIKRRS